MKTVIVILFVVAAQTCHAQRASKNDYDPYIPGKGKFNGSLLTTYTGITPPPVLIADVMYGLTRKTAIGFTGGTIGTLALLGAKVNTTLYNSSNFRVLFKLNVIYYPERNGTFLFDQQVKHVAPWMFTLGTFNAEWKSPNNTRWSAGAGMLESHCIQGMMNIIKGSKEGGNMMFEFFTTAYAAVAIPLSPRLTLRPELVVVMKDFKPIPTHLYKFSPYNPYIAVTYSFGKK